MNKDKIVKISPEVIKIIDMAQKLLWEISDDPMLKVKILSRLQIIGIEIEALLSQQKQEMIDKVEKIFNNKGYLYSDWLKIKETLK